MIVAFAVAQHALDLIRQEQWDTLMMELKSYVHLRSVLGLGHVRISYEKCSYHSGLLHKGLTHKVKRTNYRSAYCCYINFNGEYMDKKTR